MINEEIAAVRTFSLRSARIQMNNRICTTGRTHGNSNYSMIWNWNRHNRKGLTGLGGGVTGCRQSTCRDTKQKIYRLQISEITNTFRNFRISKDNLPNWLLSSCNLNIWNRLCRTHHLHLLNSRSLSMNLL